MFSPMALIQLVLCHFDYFNHSPDFSIFPQIQNCINLPQEIAEELLLLHDISWPICGNSSAYALPVSDIVDDVVVACGKRFGGGGLGMVPASAGT